MSLGLFVEGLSDRRAIPILIRKLGYRARITSKELSQSELLLPDKMAVHIRELLRVRKDVELILICIDSERVDPTETERRTAPFRGVSMKCRESLSGMPSSITRWKAGLHVIRRPCSPFSALAPASTYEATQITTQLQRTFSTECSERMAATLGKAETIAKSRNAPTSIASLSVARRSGGSPSS